MKAKEKMELLGYEIIEDNEDTLIFKKEFEINNTSRWKRITMDVYIEITFWDEFVDFYIQEKTVGKRRTKIIPYDFGTASFEKIQIINEIIQEAKERSVKNE